MKTTLCTLAMLLCGLVQAQEQWSRIFSTDPYKSNGYFIVDQRKWSDQHLGEVQVDIKMATTLPDGSVNVRKLQHCSITGNFFVKANLGFLDSIQTNQRAYYQVSAFDQAGNLVFDFEGLPPGGGPIWPEQCKPPANCTLQD